MYAHQDEWDVEEICYDDSHIDKVIEELRKNFDGYFEQLLKPKLVQVCRNRHSRICKKRLEQKL